MRLRYTRPALADLDGILDHIALQSPLAADRVQARIAAVIDLLLSYPELGILTADPTVRRAVASPYPYSSTRSLKTRS